MKIEKINNKNCKDCGNKADYIIHFKYQVDTITSVYLCESCLDKLQKLEKPKKKIKKWQWLIFDKEDNSVYATNRRFACESEVQKYFEDEETDRVLYPIKESEIEVEE